MPLSPPLTLMRGRTYVFNVNTSTNPNHPFSIRNTNVTTGTLSTGVTNNDINNGVLTFAVPCDAPATLYYICHVHSFGSTITITN